MDAKDVFIAIVIAVIGLMVFGGFQLLSESVSLPEDWGSLLTRTIHVGEATLIGFIVAIIVAVIALIIVWFLRG